MKEAHTIPIARTWQEVIMYGSAHDLADVSGKPVFPLSLESVTDGSPLEFAVRKGRPSMVVKLIELGAKLNDIDPLSLDSLAHLAVRRLDRQDIEVLRILADAGAPLNSFNKRMLTPIMLAAKLGKTAIVAELVSRNVDLNLTGTSGMRASHVAAASENPANLEIMLTATQDVVPDATGRTELHLAASEGRQPMIEVALKHGADPNDCDYFGKTPLHYAVLAGSDASVVTLINAGADPCVKDNIGWRAADYLREAPPSLVAQLQATLHMFPCH